MAMYLGDKPVKAIARSKNNLTSVNDVNVLNAMLNYRVEAGNAYTFSTLAIMGNCGLNIRLLEQNALGATVIERIRTYYHKNAATVSTLVLTFTPTKSGWVNINAWNIGAEGIQFVFNLKKIMLNEGSTALPYEPYNQLFTAPIKKCVGKNLFDLDDYDTVDGRMAYSVKSLKIKKTYSLIANDAVLATIKISPSIYSSWTNAFGGDFGKNGKSHIPFTTARYGISTNNTNPITLKDKHIFISVVVDGVIRPATPEDIKKYEIMLCEGSTALPYEPYKEWYEY